MPGGDGPAKPVWAVFFRQRLGLRAAAAWPQLSAPRFFCPLIPLCCRIRSLLAAAAGWVGGRRPAATAAALCATAAGSAAAGRRRAPTALPTSASSRCSRLRPRKLQQLLQLLHSRRSMAVTSSTSTSTSTSSMYVGKGLSVCSRGRRPVALGTARPAGRTLTGQPFFAARVEFVRLFEVVCICSICAR